MLDYVTLLFIPKSEVAIIRQPAGQVLVLERSLDHPLTQVEVAVNSWEIRKQCNTLKNHYKNYKVKVAVNTWKTEKWCDSL